MKAFFRNFLASLLAILTSFFLILLISFIIIGGMIASVSSEDQEITKVKDNSILHIELDRPVVENASDNPFENFDFSSFQTTGQIGIKDVLDNIEKAQKDDRIKGIYLDISIVEAGIATVEDIRNKLIEFKKSGKFIIAYSEIYTQKAYYLASVADKVYLNPSGLIEFKGLSAQLMFFKNMLDNIGVEMQIIRGKNNKFKSAVEPFMYDKMSDANREQTRKFLGTIWDHMVENMAKSRGISADYINMIADSILVRDGESAVKYKLADGMKFEDEIIAMLKEKSELDGKKDLRLVDLYKYKKAKVSIIEEDLLDKFKRSKIAIVYAAGEIQSGKSKGDVMGSETIVEALRDARKDTTIKAIVLRVNSPGGSALASDVMWREVILAKKVKPVIVSMGDVAASGGYYISCAADKIYAQPNTITGSIGVFGTLPNLKPLMENKIGITTDTVKTNMHSDLMTVFRALSPEEYDIIQYGVEKVYDDFISKVAEGRNMTKEMVDSIGQGRVWAGSDAIEIGLVDELGGLEAAIKGAAEKASLEKYRVVTLPKKKKLIEQIVADFEMDAKEKIIKSELGAAYPYYMHTQKMMQMKGVQARMPYSLNIY